MLHVFDYLQKNNVDLRVPHTLDEDWDEAFNVRLQYLLTDWLLGQRKPELARLQGHRIIVILGPQHHVLQQEHRVKNTQSKQAPVREFANVFTIKKIFNLCKYRTFLEEKFQDRIKEGGLKLSLPR